MKKGMFMVTCLMISLMILMGTLAGCGPAPAPTQPSGSQGTQAPATKAPDPTRAAPVTLRVTVFDRSTPGQTPVDNNYWTKWIQEQFGDPNNIKMEFVPCPRSQEVEMLNVWMAANQAPDICKTYNRDVVYNYYKNNGLADLTDALEKYGQQYKEFAGSELLSHGLFGGKQYALFGRRIMVARAGTFIRKDWLDALGLPMPETTDAFYEALKAFKEKNPGKVDKVVPFVMTEDAGWTGSGFFESFMEPVSDEEYYVNGMLFIPGYKEGARFLNKMYNEGLISPEFALDKDGKMADADITRGAAGAYTNNYDIALRNVPGHILALRENVPTANLVPVDPFTNKFTGKRQKQAYEPVGVRLIVPRTSQNKANEVVKYLNWMANADVLFHLQNGIEGIGHIMENGLPKVQKVEGEYMFPSIQNIDYTLVVNGAYLPDQSKIMKLNSLSYPGLEHLFEDALTFAMRDSYVAPNLPIPVDAQAKYGKQLVDKEREIYARVITARPADFDSVWEASMQEYLRAGGQEVINEKRAAWQAQRK